MISDRPIGNMGKGYVKNTAPDTEELLRGLGKTVGEVGGKGLEAIMWGDNTEDTAVVASNTQPPVATIPSDVPVYSDPQAGSAVNHKIGDG
jgi:hypothetical protein